MNRNNNRTGWLIGLSCLGGCLLCFAMALVAGVVWVSRNRPHRDQHLNTGIAYYHARQYQRAVNEYTLSIQNSPKDPNGYLWRAVAYYRMHEFDLSIADNNMALVLAKGSTFSSLNNPKYIAGIYYNRGLDYYDKRDYTQAYADFSQALTANPNSVSAYVMRGDVSEVSHKYDRALSDFAKAIQIDPSDSSAFLARANLYMAQKRYAESVADFTRVTQLAPSYTIGWGNLGWTQYETGDLSNAVRSTQKALRLDPNLTYARLNLGLYYAVQNNWTSARTEYKKALAHSRPQEIKAGLDDVQDALNRHPDSPELKQALALLQSAQYSASASH